MAKVEIPTSESFPSNSHRKKELEREVEEKKKDIQQVTSNNAIKRKKVLVKNSRKHLLEKRVTRQM